MLLDYGARYYWRAWCGYVVRTTDKIHAGLISWPVESPAGWNWYATIQSWHVELKDKLNPYGEVTTAWSQLHGPIVDLRFGHQCYYYKRDEKVPSVYAIFTKGLEV